MPGAKFSVGDLHFSQGDGEISFCGAIEMAGVITLKLSVMKRGMKDLDMKSPMFLPGPVEPHYGPGRYLTFEGFSVDEKGVQVSDPYFLTMLCWNCCQGRSLFAIPSHPSVSPCVPHFSGTDR